MSWVKKLEDMRSILIGGTVTICFAMLAVAARRDPISWDLFWHIQTGLDWIKLGLDPWTDHYSFALNNQAIASQPVLFQALLAWLVDQVGLILATHLVKFLSMTLSLALSITLLKILRAPVVVYLLVLPLMTVLLELRSMVRPEIFSYSLSILALILYHRALNKLKFSTAIPIVLLMLFWSNYHSSIFGYIIFFGFFVETGWMMIKQRASQYEWLRWLGWGATILAVGFLNPTFTHSIIAALNFSDRWVDFIQEYGPSHSRFKGNIAIYSLLFVTVITALFAVWKRRPGYFIVIAILFFYASQVSRLVVPSGIIVLCIFAIMLVEIDFKNWAVSLPTLSRHLVGAITTALVLIAISYGVLIPRSYLHENQFNQTRYPYALAGYMDENGLAGRILNEYEIGGFLIYKLSPQSKVWIDGRTEILYPPEHYERHLKARNDAHELNKVLDEYNVDFAILNNTTRTFKVIHESREMALDFMDHRYSLFVRDGANFPVSGSRLAYPSCFSKDDSNTLSSELALATWMLPGDSPLIKWLQIVIGYTNAEQPSLFISEFKKDEFLIHHINRFLAFRALELNMNLDAIYFLYRFTHWELDDFLAASIANMRLGEWEEVENLLDEATKVAWPNVTPGQTILLYRILKTLENDNKLSTIKPAYVEKLEANVRSMQAHQTELTLDVKFLCNEQRAERKITTQ